jgi:multiple sugar transport system permease protein
MAENERVKFDVKNIKSMNKKYQREKHIKEAFTAWLFLLPNFLGFLLVTFFPIFATLILSFSEWDGLSYAKPSEITLKFYSDQPAAEDIKLEKGTVLYLNTTKTTFRDEIVTIPYSINEDIQIPDNSLQYGLFNISYLKNWKDPRNILSDGTLIIQPLIEKIETNYQKYIRPEEVYFDDQNISAMNIRFEQPQGGMSLSYNGTPQFSGKEIVITKKTKQALVIAKGTIILADLSIKTPTKQETKTWTYTLKNDLVLKKGETNIKGITALTANETGQLGKGPNQIINNPKNAEGVLMTLMDGKPLPFKIKVAQIPNIGNFGLQLIGFGNFEELILRDSRFRMYFLNTLFFLLEIPIGMIMSLIMALAMNQPLKGIVVFRVLFFLPVISNIVAIALLWRWILNSDYGFLNELLRAIGISNPPQWFGDKTWAKIAIIIMDVWKGAGYNMMLYLAGLQGIPHFLYEAADIDGASGWQQFMNITWPLLSSTNFFILIMGIIGGFQAFGTQYVMTSGGPAGSTTTLVYYIYNNAYQWSNMGYATAIAVILFVFVMVITIINMRLTQGKVEY